jgi:hypothetical protein
VGRSAVHVPSVARRRDDGPLTFRDQVFTGRILIDDKSFEHCTFREAVLVYAGGAPPQIVDCSFHDAAFEFQGAAGRALAFLQALSAPSSGLRDIFKASFPRLFGH